MKTIKQQLPSKWSKEGRRVFEEVYGVLAENEWAFPAP
jgi:hypothetical protein